MKKRLLAALLTVAMVASFGACGAKKEEATTGEATEETVDSDVAYIQEKGTLVVGITDFAPMDYKDDNGTNVRTKQKNAICCREWMLIWRKRLPSHLA